MISLAFDPSAPKKPINLTVNSDLLRKAKERRINISSVLEARLAEEIRIRVQKEWLEENQAAIDDYNIKSKSLGLFSDGLRSF